MVPGFVRLGAVAVLFQLSVVAAFYGYLRRRRPVADPTARRRAAAVLAAGAALVAVGQLAALGAVGSLRTSPLLSLRQAILVQNAGVVASLAGYLCIVAGAALHARAGG